MLQAILFLVIAGTALGCSTPGFPEPPPGLFSSENAIRAGERRYQKDCSLCHGPGGHGDGPQARSLDPAPSDLRNLSGRRSEPGYWFFRVKEGGKAEPLARARSAMPAWGDHLSDREIWEIVAYLSVLKEGRT